MFRYYHLLAPVLGGDDSLYADVDASATDATLQSLMEEDPELCKFSNDQIHLFKFCYYIIICPILFFR